jgi:uncharacterized protein
VIGFRSRFNVKGLIVTAGVFLLFFLPITAFAGVTPPIGMVDEVCISNGSCFGVTVAKTDAERAQGLMYRTFLAPREGMLFVFDKEAIYPFWMKDTLISLDIVWVAADYRVVHIETHTLPLNTRRLIPSAKAKYVLEVVAGSVKKSGIRVGDMLQFRSSKIQ